MNKKPFSEIWKINIIVVCLLTVIFMALFFWQIKNAQKIFLSHVLKDAKIMGRLIEENITSSILAESAIEQTIKSLLESSADFTSYLDEIAPFTNEELTVYAKNAGLYGIYITRQKAFASGPETWTQNISITNLFNTDKNFIYLPNLNLYLLGIKNSSQDLIVIGLKSDKIKEIKKRISADYLMEKIKKLPGIKNVALLKNQEIKTTNHITVNLDNSSKSAIAKVKLDDSILKIDFDSTAYFLRKASIEKEFGIFILAIIFSGFFFSWLLIKVQAIHINQVKEFERNLAKEKEDALMGRAAGTIAHEIKNPVNTIYMGLQRLYYENENLNTEEKELLEILMESSSRIASITDNLKNYTKPFSPNLQSVNPKDIISQILKAYTPDLNLKEIQIVFHEENYFISADKNLFFTLCDNIIKNAAEACPSKGKVVISIKKQGLKIIIEFKNSTDKSFSGKDIEMFTQPYYTSKIKGTGLGLAICQKITSAHGWSFKINLEKSDIIVTIETDYISGE